MKQVIEELKAIPGVVGGCIFDSRKGIIANNLPPIFKEAKLSNIGKLLSKMYASGKNNFSDITEISLYYEESVVIVREASANMFLIAICDPSVNLNLLSMSLNLIMDDFSSLSGISAESPEPLAEKKFTADEILQSGTMANDLNGMKSALAKVMGPRAKIIFIEALEEWLKRDTPSYASLENLIGILDKEISDADKAAYYRELILPYLEPKH